MKVRLRPLTRADLEPYRRWVNDPRVKRLVDRTGNVSREDHRRWYRRVTTSPEIAMFAVEDRATREYIGNVWLFDIHPRHRRAEVRIVLPGARGHGADALREIKRLGFRRYRLAKLFAYVLAINPRARRAFEKAGFRLEAVLRKHAVSGRRRIDVYILSARARSSRA